MRTLKPAKPDESKIDRAIDAGILVGLAVLILVGFATSYRTLRDLAVTEGGYPPWLAPAVPLSFDLGIVVLSLKVTRAAREGRTAPVMRALVVLLSTATVLANASAATTLTARLLHVVPVAMFVVCFESVLIAVRRQALQQRGLIPPPLPRVRGARWILAFSSTWAIWRSMVLASDAPQGSSPCAGRPCASPGSIAAGVPRSVAIEDRSARAIPPAETGSRGTDVRRDAIAARLLAEAPTISAPELSRRLGSAGWPTSARTAQRIRARLLPSEASPVGPRRTSGPAGVPGL